LNGGDFVFQLLLKQLFVEATLCDRFDHSRQRHSTLLLVYNAIFFIQSSLQHFFGSMTYDDGIAVWGPLAVQVQVLNTYDSEVVLTVFLETV